MDRQQAATDAEFLQALTQLTLLELNQIAEAARVAAAALIEASAGIRPLTHSERTKLGDWSGRLARGIDQVPRPSILADSTIETLRMLAVLMRSGSQSLAALPPRRLRRAGEANQGRAGGR